MLDTFITAGVIGNLIVFILNIATKLSRIRIALWTFAIVHVLLLLFSMLVFARLVPKFSLPPVAVGHLVSFAIWAGLHYALRHRSVVYS